MPMNPSATRPNDNPLLQPWTRPFGLAPFELIRPDHFEPAFAQAMADQRAELDAIAQQPEAPTFDNTVAAFDASGRLLARLEGVFHNLCASETTSELQAVQRRLAQPLAAHNNAVYMHAGLFARINGLFEQRSSWAWTRSRCACWSACTWTLCGPAPGWKVPNRRGTPR